MAMRAVGAVAVVGGGIAGVQAALDLAESGFEVYIVERSPSIGGVMAQLDKTFPTNDCAICILAPKLVDAGRHPNIKLKVLSEVTSFKGQPGNFSLELTRKTYSVDPERCTGCGDCASVCPIEGTNPFDENLGVRKAIYVPFPQAVPLMYSIDRSMCIGCGECSKFCRAGAIDFEAEETVKETLEVGSVILAPGFDEFDPSKLTAYGYGRFQNVLTSMEFERLMSASGPTGGHVVRPSDGRAPKKIAFLHCIGSRDKSLGIPYCSTVCCMYSLKEAVIAKEHMPNVETHLFAMDFRAVGKHFEEYRMRAEHEIGVKITLNNRIGSIDEDKQTSDLFLLYVEGDKVVEERFDMVVLGVGLRPPATADHLARTFGVELDDQGFLRTSYFRPLETNVPGVFVAGTFSAPKDIPDSVTEASGTAAKASAVIASARGSLVHAVELPPERDVSGEPPRIGVFICHCGVNIAGVVDVPAVAAYAAGLPNVVHASHNLYTCSADTNMQIKSAIETHGLNRIVVASCTPRTHEALFRRTVREAGLNTYLFEMANIRDQCSWAHMREHEAATRKAKDLVRMAVARAALLTPLKRPRFKVERRALVIGGGLAGMVAALEISAQGYEAVLVEKTNALGGNMRRVTHSITGEDPQAMLKDTIARVQADPRVTVCTGTEVEDVKGYVGNFDVTLKDGSKHKVGAIVVATGAIEYRPTEYYYGKNPNVMTQLELEEEMTKGAFIPKDVVIVQCVGARDKEHPNCSRICCTTSVKNAIALKRANPEASIYIVYKDIRTYGFREDAFLEAARMGVVFVHYDEERPIKRSYTKKGLVLTIFDKFTNTEVTLKPDLLVLNAATHPDPRNSVVAKLLKVPLTHEGFFLEAHSKLRPVEFATDGVFAAGLALGPRFISESICQACAVAAKVSAIFSRDEIEGEAVVATVDEAHCRACGRCRDVCEYRAIDIIEVAPLIFASRVNEALCKGCGVCAVTCPTKAIKVRHFTDDQIDTMLEVLLAGQGVV